MYVNGDGTGIPMRRAELEQTRAKNPPKGNRQLDRWKKMLFADKVANKILFSGEAIA
ncbi:MAG: hypothetical protein JJT96_05725 [Opitutales bacterium]|nr:hypothetical protein [Opitutales bacterium]